MKLYLDAKTSNGESVALELTVASEDTIKAVKARALLAEPDPFPEQKLLHDGRELPDEMRLLDSGVQDGSHLEFVSCASEKALLHQLQQMLQPNVSMRMEELSLMYSLKHGVNIGQALRALGEGELLLQAFLERHDKCFAVEDGCVKMAASKANAAIVSAAQLIAVTMLVTLQVPSATQELESLELQVDGQHTVASVKERTMADAQVPFTDDARLLLKGQPLDDHASLADCGVADASTLELVATWSEELFTKQLGALLLAQGPMSNVELDNAYCCRYGISATQALHMLGWGEKLQAFLMRQPTIVCEKGSVAIACVSPAALTLERNGGGNQAYLDLHAKLCGGGFQGRAMHLLDSLAVVLREETFLNVSRVVSGGAVAAGVAIPGAVGAELTLHLEGLPPTGWEACLAGLAKAVSGVLGETLRGRENVTEVLADGLGVQLRTSGILGDVRILFAPAYTTFAEALQAVNVLAPEAKSAVSEAVFAEYSTRFSERLPDGVKAAVRLLRWWRKQQQWSSKEAQPSDALLELVVVHAVAQRTPHNLREAVEGAFSELTHFEDLHVMWPTSVRRYRESDWWAPLLEQKPLVTHPTNPFLNVAASNSFQPNEMVECARSGKLI